MGIIVLLRKARPREPPSHTSVHATAQKRDNGFNLTLRYTIARPSYDHTKLRKYIRSARDLLTALSLANL